MIPKAVDFVNDLQARSAFLEATQPTRLEGLSFLFAQCPCLLLKVCRSVQDLAAEFEELTGIRLPQTPNTIAGSQPRAIWLGPSEWLIVDERGTEDLVERVSTASEIWQRALLTTPALVKIEVSGRGAADLLGMGCPIDFHLSQFPVNSSARTLFEGMPVIVCRRTQEPCLEIFVDESLARHFSQSLLASANDSVHL